jgi:hypothetical protein
MSIYPNNSNHLFCVMETAHIYCGLRNGFFNITEISFILHTVDSFMTQASCSVDASGSFPRRNVAGVWSWPLLSLWCRGYGVHRDSCTLHFTVRECTCFFCPARLSKSLFTIKVNFTLLSETWFYEVWTNEALLCCCVFQKIQENKQRCGHHP